MKEKQVNGEKRRGVPFHQETPGVGTHNRGISLVWASGAPESPTHSHQGSCPGVWGPLGLDSVGDALGLCLHRPRVFNAHFLLQSLELSP